MNLDDIIYLALLIATIIFGYFYRTILDKNTKKNLGTLAGLLVVLTVSGIHILHAIVSTVIGALIIFYVDKRKCHAVCFVFSFLYLLFFRNTIYFGIPYPPAHTNLVQMILTLKLVGLSLEVSQSLESKKRKDSVQKSEEEKCEDEFNAIDNLQFIDVIHYIFNCVGVLTGPYYKYRTFIDSIEKPYSKYDNWQKLVVDKVKYIPVFAALFLLATYLWPLSYATSDEFYNNRSWLYRWWYIWPNFFIFRMRMYIGLLLSECACITAGLGLYPSLSVPKPGHGPSQKFKELKQITDTKELASLEYNYQTIHNINPYGTEFCVTYREGMKNWNICVQYWLVVNVHKRFPIKKYRTLATVLASSFWHGVYTGYYICLGTIPIALMVEDVWVKILLKDHKGTWLKINEWIVWIYKMNMFSYQAIAFHLLEVGKIMKFYNSFYHAGFILHIVLYVIGFQVLKIKKAKDRKSEKKGKTESEEQIKEKVN